MCSRNTEFEPTADTVPENTSSRLGSIEPSFAHNGLGGGTCTDGDSELLGELCDIDGDCGAEGFCSLDQEDYNTDSLGDACDPDIVPEPSQWLMLVAGTALLGLLYRRRARSLRIG